MGIAGTTVELRTALFEAYDRINMRTGKDYQEVSGVPTGFGEKSGPRVKSCWARSMIPRIDA